MTSRREFLQIGIAAGALPLAAHTALAAAAQVNAASPQAAAVPVYKVVYDLRYSESVAFARSAEMRGLSTHGIEGDMTRFWYDDLYHRWRQGPAAIAGLTAHGALFCLERLAWDQGMRVVFRAEHTTAADCVLHRLSGPVAILPDARRAVGDVAWSAELANVVTRCPSGRSEIGEATARGPASSRVAPNDEPLYSWLIAPAARV